MSVTLLTLVLLASPGFIFHTSRQFFERTGNRISRDVVRLVSEIMIVSLPISIAVYFSLNWAGEGLGTRFAADVSRQWQGQCPYGCGLEDIINRSLIFLVVASFLSFFLGLLWGKFAVWVLYTRIGAGNPVQRLKAGYRPPVVEASVLASTKVGSGNLVYRGLLHDIQMGPEGRIDYVLLRDPTKSILDMPHLHFRAVPRTPKALDFVSIAEEDFRDGMTNLNDFILIESEDIANVFFRSGNLDSGDWLDRLFHKHFGRKVEWVPPHPPKETRPPSQQTD